MKVYAGILMLLSLANLGQSGQGEGFAYGRLSPSERMMWSTYAVGTAKGMASCFVVARKDAQAPGGVVPVVVTSVHVLNTASRGPYYFAMRSPDAQGHPHVTIIKYTPQTKVAYVRHPTLDIAAFELRIPAEVADVINFPSFLPEAGIGKDGPEVGRPVLLLGFPSVFPATAGAFPVLRGGTVASYSAGIPADRQRFLINAQVYPGDSGGPVFAASKWGRPRLIGMVTQRVGNNPTAAVPIAVAVDASAIRETLNLLPSQPRAAIVHSTRPAEAKIPASRVVQRK